MDSELQSKCLELIKEYNENVEIITHHESKKNKHIAKRYRNKSNLLRNQIFELMSEWQIKWVKSILHKWKRYETEQEILSVSWDCFEFCLNRYSNYAVPIPKFFYDYTRYCLLMHYGKKDHVFLPIDELKETLGLIDSTQNVMMERMLTLVQFRDVIPDKYKVVWDDAVRSLRNDIKGDRGSKTTITGMDDRLYYKLKQGYIPIVKLILGKN